MASNLSARTSIGLSDVMPSEHIILPNTVIVPILKYRQGTLIQFTLLDLLHLDERLGSDS